MAAPPPSSSPSSAPASASTSQQKLDPTTFRALHPRRYLKEWLDAGFRPEKKPRKVDEWREVGINVGAISTASGSTLIRLGDTTIICGIKAEIAEPSHSHPNQGWIVPNLDLPALCSPMFKPGPPVDEAQVMSQQLADLIESTSPIPLTSLCIQPGKAAWVIYVDLVCINYDGNAFDAAVLAMMIGLRDTVIPVATYNPDTSQTLCSRTEKRRLGDAMKCMPITCSFGLFDNQYLLPDPSSFESPLLSTTITIAYDILPLLSASSTTESTADSSKLKLKLVRQNGLGGLKGQSGIDVLGRSLEMARRRVMELAENVKEVSGRGGEDVVVE